MRPLGKSTQGFLYGRLANVFKANLPFFELPCAQTERSCSVVATALVVVICWSCSSIFLTKEKRKREKKKKKRKEKEEKKRKREKGKEKKGQEKREKGKIKREK